MGAGTAFAAAIGCDGRGRKADVRRMLHWPEGGWSNSSIVTAGNASLGACARISRHGELAQVASEGRSVAVASANLTKRDSLAAALHRHPSGTDAELILAAYATWGEECVRWLSGDFAFVIWSQAEASLFCARDHFGVRPLYFAQLPDVLLIGSTIDTILRAPAFDATPSEPAVADFLMGAVTDATSTLYQGLQRLPAGHVATLRNGEFETRRYWSLRPGTLQAADHPAGFRRLFTESIAERLGNESSGGALLSGGLDSSSIACIAGRIAEARRFGPLPTFSVVYDSSPRYSERRFIEMVLEQGHFTPTFVEGSAGSAFIAPDSRLGVTTPSLAPNFGNTLGVLRRARDRMIDFVLCGHGGDEVVSHGYGRLYDLARDHRWMTLWRQLRAVRGLHGGARWRLFCDLAATFGGRSLAGRSIRSGRAIDIRLRGPRQGGPITFASDALLKGTSALSRIGARRPERRDQTEQELHVATLSAPLQAYAFEVLDSAVDLGGVEQRFPFWDRELVEFCVSLRAEEKLDHGWSRLVLRRAMEGILPPAIQWRRDKLDFTPHLVARLVGPDRPIVEDVLASRALAGYVKDDLLAGTWSRLTADGSAVSGAEIQALWRATALGLWLGELRRRPHRQKVATR